MPSTRHAAFQAALQKKYRAVAFDFDGTLTPFARFEIPTELKIKLAHLPPHVPRALCTGRDLKFVRQQLDNIVAHAENPNEEKKRWTLFTENGAEGFVWNAERKDFEQFFEVEWPETTVPQEKLVALLSQKGGFWNRVLARPHTVVMRHHNWIYYLPKLTRIFSRRMHKKLERWIREEWAASYLQIQDSGIGNVVLPVLAGKGNAMRRWVERLKIDPKTLVVVGDQAAKGGNDYDFLSGEVGTAFTVGELSQEAAPLAVFDAKGRRLQGPEGTRTLLENIHWETLHP